MCLSLDESAWCAVVQDIIGRYVNIAIVSGKGLVIQLPVCKSIRSCQWRKYLADENMSIKESNLAIFKPYTQKMISDILCTHNLNVPCRNIWIAYSITNDHTWSKIL